MSTAKPQRTKGKPAKAEAPHEHKWQLSADPDSQHCPGCGSFRRMVCDYPEHAAFGDLLAALVRIESGTEAMPARRIARAAIAKAKPSKKGE